MMTGGLIVLPMLNNGFRWRSTGAGLSASRSIVITLLVVSGIEDRRWSASMLDASAAEPRDRS